ncbi:short-chain dehydrogenase/reductase SDR [Viridothelium virens]|uniref:Short-chain dehydrogenase/reductase SDR n=1 Tax=Viridothelium virens TaxID=1048519 RepID=A0A6A6GTT5_VIRVR|nr:short-chain dehydrogenase/reductase SDR [Viridothelium virens]
MARILVTGSSDGLGQIAARSLISQGHEVYLHARNPQRAQQARESAPGAKGVLVGDLSSIAQTKALAAEANKIGKFDAVMHNAALGTYPEQSKSEDGIEKMFAVNSLSQYILTCLMERPKRLVYVSSGLHSNGDPSLQDVAWTSKRSFASFQAYCDTKLHNILLSNAVARHWNNVESNACNPGWVKTKLGTFNAPGDPQAGARTQVHLTDPKQDVGSGRYWSDMKPIEPQAGANDIAKQEEFLKICQDLSGIAFPKN